MGLFAQFKQGLTKTRDFLSQGIKKLNLSLGRFNEDQLDELELLLMQTDMGVAAVDEMMAALRQEIRSQKSDQVESILEFLRQHILQILGPKKTFQIQRGQLNILLMVGVNGTGKTTTAGKLAHRYSQAGHRILFCAADTFRAAAIEQLGEWAKRTQSPMIAHEAGGDPAAVVFDAVSAAKSRAVDLLIIDTAGRLHNKKNLMDELAKIRRIIDREAPEAQVTTLLVIDATTGQNAVFQAKTFQEVAKVDQVCLSKLDGNAKGGVAVAVCQETNLPITFAGLGEGLDDLVDFDPDAFVQSLLPTAEQMNPADE